MAVKVDTSRVDALKQTVEEVVSTYYLLTACASYLMFSHENLPVYIF